jgi:hypothetical protein
VDDGRFRIHAEVDAVVGLRIWSPPPTVLAARWIAAAHSFFPFATFPAALPAAWSACFACFRSDRAFFAGLLPARSMRVVAWSSFFRADAGMV